MWHVGPVNRALDRTMPKYQYKDIGKETIPIDSTHGTKLRLVWQTYSDTRKVTMIYQTSALIYIIYCLGYVWDSCIKYDLDRKNSG